MAIKNSDNGSYRETKGNPRFFLKHKKSSAFLVTVAFHVAFIVLAVVYVAVEAIKKPEMDAEFIAVERKKQQPEKIKVSISRSSGAPQHVNMILASPKVEVNLEMPKMVGTSGNDFGDISNLSGSPNAVDGDRTFGDNIDIDISKNINGNELIGTFYDLKQEPDGSLTEIGERAATVSFGRETQLMATEVIDKFISSGCNPRRLEDYFKAPKYKSAKTFMMPPMRADRAPEAFRVQDRVKGSYWVCHYTGQIAAPETGRYRFCGIGDDVLVVRIGKKVVLDASWPELIGQVTSWESDDDNSRRFSINSYKYGGFRGDVWNQLYSQIEKSGGFEGEETLFGSALRNARVGGVSGNDNYMSAACRMVIGDWVELKKGEPVNIDVVIGEIPGGEFTCRLLIEQQGKAYQMVRSDAGMRPVLPVFKTVELDSQLIDQIELDPNEMTLEGPVFGVKENSIK